MARKTATKPAAPAPEPEETDEGGAVRGPGEMHELFSEWLKEETGVAVDPEHIFLVTSKRTAFRKSDAYADYAEAVEKSREEAAAEKEKRAAARASAQEAEPEDEAPKPARRGRAKKAEADPAAEETNVAPITRARRGRAKAAEPAADEAQTETAPAKPARSARRRSAPANF